MNNQDIGRSNSKWIVMILLPLSLMWASSLCEKHSAARRSIAFEDVRLSKTLNAEFLFSRHLKTTLADCTRKCLITPECFSINFCDSGKCELNSQDAHSENAVLKEAKLCRYQGMKVSGKMSCEEEGTQNFVERNPDKSKCEMAGKQHESFWGEWHHFVEIDTSEEWKKVQQRECILYTAHASSTCNEKLSEVEIIEWYRFVHEEKYWEEAILNCRNLGGKLFSNLNGTVSQLEFLQNKVGRNGWIGGWESGNDWRNDDQEIIPSEKIIWAGNEPVMGGYMYISLGRVYSDSRQIKLRCL